MNSRTVKYQCGLGAAFAVVAVLLAQTGCERTESRPSKAQETRGQTQLVARNPERIALTPLDGDGPLDQKIAATQARARSAADPSQALERLGWLFIAKARVSFDPGFFALAEQCALAMDGRKPNSPESLLLRGYALQNLHHFKEAERVARELAQRRGCSFDYGLLGDCLMEQGRLGEAEAAYQRMADIKPDLYAYTRAAHMRWLKGDLTGAIEVMEMATQAVSARDAEPAAWVFTRMALYQLQAGELAKCRQYCDAALAFQKDYPPALLARGRLLLAQEKFGEAAEALGLAAKLNPLPEYQWALAEALRAANRTSEAEAVERKLEARGAAADPRTLALFLATRGVSVPKAIKLAQAELETRGDVFTHDALACALMAAGRFSEAAKETQLALSEGTQDARLFLHAGIVAQGLSLAAEADKFFGEAAALGQMLLPSEQAQLKDFYDRRSRVSADVSPTENNNQRNKERS
ncbi:MAG: hypothetical protein C5B50_18080 [Verrucomicrobia bacterium]|nr:MAG: hypothetical protein C5B50_18080 [Verrucomicrobiota bacterium]